MLDIKWIRQHPEVLDKKLKHRGVSASSRRIIKLDEEVRSLTGVVDHIRSQRNEVAKEMARTLVESAKEALQQKGAFLRSELESLEKQLLEKKEALKNILINLPNLPDDEVPFSEKGVGKVLRTWGRIPEFDFTPLAHEKLGASLGLDTALGVKLSGARFVVLKKALARLERACAHFMLDVQTQHFNYEEISVPYLVKEEALFGVGQLPKFHEDAFQTTDGRWLISTAEVALTNLAAGFTFKESELPKRFVAYTPCFRSEAGSAGRDMHGLIRLHQFSKVELVSFATPEQSEKVHQEMLGHAEFILQALGLPYRVVLLSADDMGEASQKTYDLEVWLPSQQTYREIASCSNCGDFQARRLKAFYKNEKGQRHLIHTLNSSGLPVGRTLAALLENYQKKDGTISLPEVLKPYQETRLQVEI